MAVNRSRMDDDYRHFKQPFELKNANELQIMSAQEKEMYAQKLRSEIYEYKHREQAYVAKREELL